MIPVAALYRYCEKMLADDWGYIWGTAGILWTKERQNNTSNEMAQKYGQKWIGHTVADCSGVMVYIWKQFGQSIAHGSNSIARKYVGAHTSKPSPGYAAFKWRSTDTSKYQDGKGDYYHIGIVAEDGKRVYEAKGTQAGFIVSSASEWPDFAPFKDVDYSIEDTDGGTPEMKIMGTVKVKSGWLNVRSGPSKGYPISGELSNGDRVEICSVHGDWYAIRCGDVSGYVASQYIAPDPVVSAGAGSGAEAEDNDGYTVGAETIRELRDVYNRLGEILQALEVRN